MGLLFLGDFLYDYDDLQDDIVKIAQWIRENNYQVILNLEGPIIKDAHEKIKKRGPNLSQSDMAIEVLKQLNVIGVCLANNHIMDYGDDGLKETINVLNENNILHTGAGDDLTNASKPMIIQDGEEIYEVYNFGWYLEETVYATNNTAGCSPREESHILNCIIERNNYKKIAIMHWGFEYNYLPMPYDIDLAHKMIDYGYDIIIGHHPHVNQPKELYNKKPVFYSIGNFYMGTRRKNFLTRLNNEVLGHGVLLNENQIKLYNIIYNHETKISISQSEEEITGVNYISKEYIKQCKRRSKNYTPILTANFIENNFKILLLKLFYLVYGKVKFLRKRNVEIG